MRRGPMKPSMPSEGLDGRWLHLHGGAVCGRVEEKGFPELPSQGGVPHHTPMISAKCKGRRWPSYGNVKPTVSFATNADKQVSLSRVRGGGGGELVLQI